MKSLSKKDLFSELRKTTKARIGLKHAGTSLSTEHQLEMMKSSARAKDAIFYPLDISNLAKSLSSHLHEIAPATNEIFCLESKVKSRQEYLRRPDLGRLLSEESVQILELKVFTKDRLNFVVVDGLSPLGVERYAKDLISATCAELDKNLIGEICLVKEGRVAIGDSIAQILGSKMSVVIIGERPGLTSFDSLGVYLTFAPGLGKTDADRNCISNICESGLPVPLAAKKLASLIQASLQLQISGTQLKEDAHLLSKK